MIMYSHTKNQILTQRNRIVICLTYFLRLSSSGSHLGVVISCDLTGGGLTFAQRVKLSVPVLNPFTGVADFFQHGVVELLKNS